MPRFYSDTFTFKHPAASTSAGLPMLSRGQTFRQGLTRSEAVVMAKKFLLPHRGTEVVDMIVPPNEAYRASIAYTIPPSSPGSFARIFKSPSQDAKGPVQVEIEYFVPFGGVTRFALKGYSRAIAGMPSKREFEILYARNMESAERLDSLLSARVPVLLCFEGDIATQLASTGLFGDVEWKVKRDVFGSPVVEINPALGIIAIVAIIAAMVVAVFVILMIQNIIIKAVELNYKIKVHEISLGNVNIAGLSIDLSLPTIILELEPA